MVAQKFGNTGTRELLWNGRLLPGLWLWLGYASIQCNRIDAQGRSLDLTNWTKALVDSDFCLVLKINIVRVILFTYYAKEHYYLNKFKGPVR